MSYIFHYFLIYILFLPSLWIFVFMQLEIFLIAGELSLTFYALVIGIFSMNIPFTWTKDHGYMFKWVTTIKQCFLYAIFKWDFRYKEYGISFLLAGGYFSRNFFHFYISNHSCLCSQKGVDWIMNSTINLMERGLLN